MSAGGDQGRDAESFWSNIANEIPAISVHAATVSGERVVLACTIQNADIPSKIRSDLNRITGQGTPVDRVLYFTVASVPVAKRHDLIAQARTDHDVELEIFDGLALAEHRADPDLFWIAAEYLKLPASLAPERADEDDPLPGWYVRDRDYWRARTEPGRTMGDLVSLRDVLRHATYAKQGAAFGYTGDRGLNLQLATISTPLTAPVIARARLRKGNTASATGVGRLLAQAIKTARNAGVTGQILARADSAYYGWAFVGTALRHKTWFSVTARMTPSVTAAITSINPDAWMAIEYPNAVYDDVEQRWLSDAEVAEVPFVAFTGRRKHEHVACRLVVRRVRRLQPLTGDGTEQGELFASYRHHAFITNSTCPRSRPTSGTVITPWSSRSSPNSRTDRWRTCRRGSTRPTQPGSPTP